MFKKTLIAAAVATLASSVAMADVSVSGQVKTYFVTTDATSAGNNGKDWAPVTDTAIDFKASEDLGNGMSVFAQISLDTDAINASTTDTTTNQSSEKDSKLGLKGGFGTLVMGRMETLSEGAVSSMMDDGGALESPLITGFARYDAIAYVSPTVNGLHAAIAGTTNGDAIETDDKDGDGMFQHIDFVVAYDNGPLSVKVARADIDAANNGTANYDVTTIAASYKIGALKVSAMNVEKDFDDTTADLGDDIYRLDYTMGNNSILLGHRSHDAGTGGTSNDLTSLKLTHKLSARTAAWVGVRDVESGADQTHFGMIHKF
jgi:hypothetical protein